MINLYVKFNVHSSYVKQVIVLKSGGQTDGRTDAPGDDNRHLPKFCLRPKKLTHVELTLTTLEYFCINHGDQSVFFNLKQGLSQEMIKRSQN